MTDDKKKPGRPVNQDVVCTWPNVWTSKGKLVKGDTANLPAAEAEALIKSGAVK